MKPINTSVYTFSDLIQAGSLYVDKTALIHRLLDAAAGKAFFLARPRRFGKSLTISTLAAIFAGRRELFKGLAIDSLPYDWKIHPVIRIDLGSRQAATAPELNRKLKDAVLENVRQLKVAIDETGDAADLFLRLVRHLGAERQVVILIDEYDKPILGNIDNPLVGEILNVLKAFYSVVKSCDAQIRFAFLAGVSKFSRVSVFSDLNNLTDLTMDSRYAALLGYTQEELEANFAGYIDRAAQQNGVDRAKLLDKIRDWYNGYRFSKAPVTVYNPVSVGKFFDTGSFNNYWFETGTPSFLLKLIKQERIDIYADYNQPVDDLSFAAYEINHLTSLPLLVQTGYLTIHSSEIYRDRTRYRLGFPNREVENAFAQYLVADLSETPRELTSPVRDQLLDALDAGDLPTFFQQLRIFFANIPYDIQLKDEKYYQSLFHVILRLLGLDVRVEVRTNNGRIDAVIEVSQFIYLFEFKVNGTAEEALAQIQEKRYAEKYLASGKEIRLVGAAFDPTTRNLETWRTCRPGSSSQVECEAE